jgi:DNA modification methylase
MIKPYYENASGRLYCGDCLEIMPQLIADGVKVDAVVTDPPYGIGESRGRNASRSVLAESVDYGYSEWDGETKQREIDIALSMSKWQIVFGGNYYILPPARCWLVWDKVNGENDFADCELAWTNLDKAVRRIVHQWHGMIREGKEARYHPTQKPLRVMQWCIKQLPSDCQTILDPFAGSGTTLVAAQSLGRKFIGIEISPEYCEIAKKRLEGTIRQIEGQVTLFDKGV